MPSKVFPVHCLFLATYRSAVLRYILYSLYLLESGLSLFGFHSVLKSTVSDFVHLSDSVQQYQILTLPLGMESDFETARFKSLTGTSFTKYLLEVLTSSINLKSAGILT